jgi:hypothetical protein
MMMLAIYDDLSAILMGFMLIIKRLWENIFEFNNIQVSSSYQIARGCSMFLVRWYQCAMVIRVSDA